MKTSRARFVIPFFLLSFLGVLDTGYITMLWYKHIVPPCSILHGCEQVITSKFSTIFGIPIEIPGLLFYIALLVLLILLVQLGRKIIFWMLFTLVVAGLLVSVVLFYLQAAVIHAFCQYCIASEIIILLLFILLIGQIIQIRKHEKNIDASS